MANKVLIYEDDLIASMVLEIMMKDHGCEILNKYDSADDLVQNVSDHAPDFILLDIMLVGEKLGTEAAIELREHSNLPIIFTSALNDKGTIETIDALGNAVLVSKPYDSDRLAEVMRELLD
ncbi:MAG: response regulator [Cytophagales bacterium]|nr:response regulator [Cytophagales bacterium]